MGNSTMSLQSDLNYQDNSLMSKESISTYFGVINPEEERLKMIYIRNSLKKQHNEEQKINLNNKNNYKIPTMFEWSFKGNSVYLTGSFCNWKEFFLMKKDENGIFRLILDLNRGFHQYKFKIDNEWKYNTNFPTFNDHGNINNYIDTTNWEISGEYENEEINNSYFFTSDIDLISFVKEKDINLKISDDFYKASVSFGTYFPKKNELYNFPPEFPYHLIVNHISVDIINTNKSKSKEKKLLDNLYIINKFCHEQINHLHLKKIKKEIPLRISMISRYRFKFVTFVYYK